MLNLLDFHLFCDALHKKQTNQRQISDPHIIYNEAVTTERQEVITY